MSGWDNYLAAQTEEHFREPNHEEWMEFLESYSTDFIEITVSLNKWGEPTATVTFDNGQTEEYDDLYELQERLEHVDEYGYDE